MAEDTIIKSYKKLEEGENYLVYEVEIKPEFQKEVYESLYKKYSTDVEIPGFRKGNAPREMVEPKIYPQIVADLKKGIADVAFNDIIDKEGFFVYKLPEVKDITFSMIEVPVKIKYKFFVVKNIPKIKLPNKKIKIPEISVTDKEVDDAIESYFVQWKEKTKNKIFEKPTDEWVKSLKLPNISNMQELKTRVKEDLEHMKLHNKVNELVAEVIKKLIKDMKLKVPQDYIEDNVKRYIEKQKEEVKKLGITLEQYLGYYKKTMDDLKKELAENAKMQFEESVFWHQFIKDNNITIDPKNSEDLKYMETVVAQQKIPVNKLNDYFIYKYVVEIAKKHKAVSSLMDKLGLNIDEDNKDDPKTDEKKSATNVKKNNKKTGKTNK